MHTHTYTYTYTYTHTRTHARTAHAHAYANKHIHAPANTHIHTHPINSSYGNYSTNRVAHANTILRGRTTFNFREEGLREGGFREGGFRKGGFPEGGFRVGGFRVGGFRKGGFRKGGFRVGGFPEGGFREGGFHVGGYRMKSTLLEEKTSSWRFAVFESRRISNISASLSILAKCLEFVVVLIKICVLEYSCSSKCPPFSFYNSLLVEPQSCLLPM